MEDFPEDRHDPMEDLLIELNREAADHHVPSHDGPAHTPALNLLPYFGTWVGDDIDELLDEVKRMRGKATF